MSGGTASSFNGYMLWRPFSFVTSILNSRRHQSFLLLTDPLGIQYAGGIWYTYGKHPVLSRNISVHRVSRQACPWQCPPWSVSCMHQSVFISQGTTGCCICICLFSCMKHLIGFPISVARLTLSPLVSLIYHAKCSRTRVNNSPAFLGFLWQGLFKNIAGPYTIHPYRSNVNVSNCWAL